MKKQDEKLFKRIVSAIQDIRQNPYLGKKLTNFYKSEYSHRVGKYRILYSFHKKKLLIEIIEINHRGNIYRTFL